MLVKTDIGSKIWCDVRMLNCNSEICKKLIPNFFNIELYKIDNLSIKARGVKGIRNPINSRHEQ